MERHGKRLVSVKIREGIGSFRPDKGRIRIGSVERKRDLPTGRQRHERFDHRRVDGAGGAAPASKRAPFIGGVRPTRGLPFELRARAGWVLRL